MIAHRRSLLPDAAILAHRDPVRVVDCGQTVGNHRTGGGLQQLFQSLLNAGLGHADEVGASNRPSRRLPITERENSRATAAPCRCGNARRAESPIAGLGIDAGGTALGFATPARFWRDARFRLACLVMNRKDACDIS